MYHTILFLCPRRWQMVVWSHKHGMGAQAGPMRLRHWTGCESTRLASSREEASSSTNSQAVAFVGACGAATRAKTRSPRTTVPHTMFGTILSSSYCLSRPCTLAKHCDPSTPLLTPAHSSSVDVTVTVSTSVVATQFLNYISPTPLP